MNITKWELTPCPSDKDAGRWRLKVKMEEGDIADLARQFPGLSRPFLLEDSEFDFGFFISSAREEEMQRLRELLAPGAPAAGTGGLLDKLAQGLDTLAPAASAPPAAPAAPVAPAENAPLPLAPVEFRDLDLNARYTFEEFIVGPSNRFTAAAAQAVADNPGKIYNPFFIYGGVGLGKTHLMHAVGHHVRRKNPNLKMLYMTTEKFMSEVIESIRQGTVLQLREHYRKVDLLLVDDIQFLVESESTQEEFFHTFNILHQNNKQIIITSDRPPRQLTTLEDRLRSRFEWGLIADIKSPNLETRVAILKKKEEAEHLRLDDNILLYIASKLKSNIRELEGFLKRINAYALLTHQTVNMDLVRSIMADLLPAEEAEEASPVPPPAPPVAPPPQPYGGYPPQGMPAQPYPPQYMPGMPPGYGMYPPQGYVVVSPVPQPPMPQEAPAAPPAPPAPAVPPPAPVKPPVPAAPATVADSTEPGVKTVEVGIFFPEGKKEELGKVKEHFREVIRKHRLKFGLEPVFEMAYASREKINYTFFADHCKKQNVGIAIVLGPPPDGSASSEDFASLLSTVMDDEKLSLQLVSWAELNKDYRYLNLALDITLLKHRM